MDAPEFELRLKTSAQIDQELNDSNARYCIAHLRERGMHAEADRWMRTFFPPVATVIDGVEQA